MSLRAGKKCFSLIFLREHFWYKTKNRKIKTKLFHNFFCKKSSFSSILNIFLRSNFGDFLCDIKTYRINSLGFLALNFSNGPVIPEVMLAKIPFSDFEKNKDLNYFLRYPVQICFFRLFSLSSSNGIALCVNSTFLPYLSGVSFYNFGFKYFPVKNKLS